MDNFTFATRIRWLALIGVVISVELLYHHLAVTTGFQRGPSFCTINSIFDCDRVTRSPLSEVFGIPLASIGVLYYLILLGITCFARAELGVSPRALSSVITLWTLLGLPPSLALLALSVVQLNTVCLICLLLDTTNLALFIVALRFPEKEPFLKALSDGVRAIVSFIYSAFRKSTSFQSQVVARMSLFLVVTTAVTLYLVPGHVVLRLFSESLRQEQQSKLAQQAITQWKQGHELPVDLVEDGTPAERDFILGGPQAPITIVEFSDFECPYCRKIAPQLKELVIKNPGKVRLVYKNYPLDTACNSTLQRQMHEFACRAAQMARCAGEEDPSRFWRMHQALMEVSSFSDATLAQLPVEVGASPTLFETCMENPETGKRVEKDVNLAIKLGITSTPTIYINRKLVPVPLMDVINSIVESEIKNQKGAPSA